MIQTRVFRKHTLTLQVIAIKKLMSLPIIIFKSLKKGQIETSISKTGTKRIRTSYVKNLIIGQLNLNFFRNKFLSVNELFAHNLELLVINETKLDDSFPNVQWLHKIETSLLEVFVFTQMRIFHLNNFILNDLRY